VMREMCALSPSRQSHRHRAAGLDLLDEALGDELGDRLARRAAGQIWRPFEGTVIALRSRCQQPLLGFGQFHGILHSVATAIGAATTEAPQWPKGRRGRIPEGCSRQERDSTAPFAQESQFFPDHLVAGFGPNRSWFDPLLTEIDSDISRFELVSRWGFRVLTEVPTFQEVSGQESGLWRRILEDSRRRRRIPRRVSARRISIS
jgi:hypothetical protein